MKLAELFLKPEPSPNGHKSRGSLPVSSSSVTVITSPTTGVPLYTNPQGSTPFEQIYRTSSPVRSVVDLLGRQLARYSPQAFTVAADGSEKPAPYKFPLNALLRAPAPRTSRFEWLRALVQSLCLNGNSYAVIVRDGGRVVSLVPVSSQRVSLVGPSGVDDVDGYQVAVPTGQPLKVPAADMLHLRLWSPATDPRLGVSPLESIRSLLEEDQASSLERRAFWLRASRPHGVIERPLDAPDWSDEARMRFRDDWTASQLGEKTYSTAILEEGMRWADSSRVSPIDAEFVAGRQQITAAVAGAFGVPAQVVGAVTENTRAASRLIAFALAPYIELIEDTLNNQLVPAVYATEGDRAPNVVIRLVQPGVIAEEVSDLATGVRGGVLTSNDARAQLGLPPLPDGDALSPPTAAPPTAGAVAQ